MNKSVQTINHGFATLETLYLREASLGRPAAADWLLHQVFQVCLHSPALEQSLGLGNPLDALPCLKKNVVQCCCAYANVITESPGWSHWSHWSYFILVIFALCEQM